MFHVEIGNSIKKIILIKFQFVRKKWQDLFRIRDKYFIDVKNNIKYVNSIYIK